jgi:hypothetical protein
VKIWLLIVIALGCQNAAKQEQAATSASAAPAASAAPVASAAPKPWFEGGWQGAYQAELHRIELPVGGVKEWKKDDGSAASGAGTLSLTAAADGSVTGSAKGPLGEHQVSGRVEGDTVALSLVPAAADGFRGTILAAKAPEGIKGTLQASSGDSLTVRKANVTLSKAAP